MNAQARWFARLTGRPPTGPINARWPELIAYAWRRGGVPGLRGLWLAWRLGGCGGKFFVGRGTRILFPRHLQVGRRVQIGEYAWINAFGRDGIRIGNGVSLREYAWVQVTSQLHHPGVGLRIGDDTYIGPRVVLGAGGGIDIGRRVLMGAGVHLLAENHAFDGAGPIADQGVTRRGIRIEDGAWIGDGVIVLDGVTVGAGAVIGAGSVVTRDVPPGAVAVGNPARVLRTRGE